MTRDDITRWVRSAIRLSADETNLTGFDQEKTILDRYEFLYWFAKEVAAAERDECAKQLDALGNDHCAAAIRARSHVQQEPQSKE